MSITVNSGELVKRPRYTMLFPNSYTMFLVVLFFQLVLSDVRPPRPLDYDSDPVGDITSPCDELEDAFERGFLTATERNSYCRELCDFLDVECFEFVEPDPMAGIKVNLTEVIDNVDFYVRKLLLGEIDEPVSPFAIDSATIDVWWSMLINLWTIALAIVPILMNQWKYTSFWSACFGVVAVMAATLYWFSHWTIVVHNALVCYFALIHSANSSYLIEVIWTLGPMLGVLFALFITDYVWHVLILVSAIIGFIMYVKFLFFSRKRGNDAGLVIMICQLMVLISQLAFVRKHFMDRSLGGAAVEAVLCAILPYGRSKLYLINASKIAGVVMFRLIGHYNLSWFLVIAGVQTSMFIGFRATLGAYYLHILRYRTDPESFLYGACVYTADLFGPVICLFRLLFNIEKPNQRRLLYAVLGLAIMWFEFHSAYDFFIFRFVVSAFDVGVLKSRYGRMTHYLQYQVDLMQTAFPQEGAMPWVSVKDLSRISEFTGTLLARGENGSGKQGMGTVLNSGGRSMLYSVAHVVDEAAHVKLRNWNWVCPEFQPVTAGDDPMVAMKVEIDEAPNIEILTPDEAFDVKVLTFINTEENGDSYVCLVPKFALTGGRLHASVNLKPGDSGGPCFAVLESGELRMCGVVSKGNARRGGGNIVSFCYSVNHLEADSSEDELSLGSVSQFNKARRVRFASEIDSSDQLQRANADSLGKFLRDHHEDFSSLSNWGRKMTHMDVDEDADSLAQHMVHEDELEQRRNRNSGDIDEEEEGFGSGKAKKQRKKDTKRRNKDKAARKRMISLGQLLYEKLKQVYTLKDSRVIFDVIMRGNVPKLDARSYIASTNGHDWVIADSLPDRDWN